MDRIEKPLVIPVFIPHSGCPHQCAFCNQSIITREKQSLPDKESIHGIIEQYLRFKGRRKSVELAFFGGNFLGLEPQIIQRLFEWVSPYILERKIDAIRFSTRPDTISRQRLDLIQPFPVSMVELGVQSMNDQVLLASKRGHTAKDTLAAISLLKEYGYRTGVQVMVGLPGDNEVSLLESTKKLAVRLPDAARIYPLLVLKNSLIEHWFKSGKYTPLSLEESVRLAGLMVNIFTKNKVNVIRVGLQSSDGMEDPSMVVAGPWHPAFGHLVFSWIMFEKTCDLIDRYHRNPIGRRLLIRVHPSSESRLRGDKNKNMEQFKQRYPDLDLSICRDSRLSVDLVRLETP